MTAMMALIVVVGALVAERLVRRAIKNYAQRVGLDKHVENLLRLATRIFIYVVGIFLVFAILGIDATTLVAVSTFTGAAIGFASTQTLGNFLAGLYVVISRPFLVGDYVRIGGSEGLVKEITINYTRLHTTTHNILRIPNREVLDSKVEIYSKGKEVDYTMIAGFDHSVKHSQIVIDALTPSVEDFWVLHREKMSAKPEFFLMETDRLGRRYGIRLIYQGNYIIEFFDLQQDLLAKILDRWDALRAGRIEGARPEFIDSGEKSEQGS